MEWLATDSDDVLNVAMPALCNKYGYGSDGNAVIPVSA